jgi:hypothetical protein
MDAVTTRVMSSACRISDILDYGVSRARPNQPAVPLRAGCAVLLGGQAPITRPTGTRPPAVPGAAHRQPAAWRPRRLVPARSLPAQRASPSISQCACRLGGRALPRLRPSCRLSSPCERSASTNGALRLRRALQRAPTRTALCQRLPGVCEPREAVQSPGARPATHIRALTHSWPSVPGGPARPAQPWTAGPARARRAAWRAARRAPTRSAAGRGAARPLESAGGARA